MSRAGGAIDQLNRPVESSHPVASRSLLVRDDAKGVEIAEQLVSLLTPDSFAADQYRALRHTVEALRKEFAQDLAHHKVEHITVDSNVAIVAVVGENMRGTPGIAGKTFNALGRENVNLIAIAQGSSECNISFVIEEQAVKTALNTTHREFGLDVSPN